MVVAELGQHSGEEVAEAGRLEGIDEGVEPSVPSDVEVVHVGGAEAHGVKEGIEPSPPLLLPPRRGSVVLIIVRRRGRLGVQDVVQDVRQGRSPPSARRGPLAKSATTFGMCLISSLCVPVHPSTRFVKGREFDSLRRLDGRRSSAVRAFRRNRKVIIN